MNDTPRIVVKPSRGITPEQARIARARALHYALDRYVEKQKAARTSSGEKGSGDQQAASKGSQDRRQRKGPLPSSDWRRADMKNVG